MVNCEDLLPPGDVHLFSPLSSDDSESTRRKKRKSRRASQKAKKTGNRVLMIGRVRELALYRAEVLRQSGFSVSAPGDLEEALRIMQRGDFDAVVLSYTLPSETVEFLADRARESCPDCPIVTISRTRVQDRRIEPDAVALADEGPTSLLTALHSVLEPNN